MDKLISTIIIVPSFIILLLCFGLTTDGENYKNNFLNHIEIFAQEENKPPLVNNSKIIEFSGNNYTDVVNGSDINLNSFTVSIWFNTIMNVTGEVDGAFLINKGGLGTDLPIFNLNLTLFRDSILN